MDNKLILGKKKANVIYVHIIQQRIRIFNYMTAFSNLSH